MTTHEWLDNFYHEFQTLNVLDALDILCGPLSSEDSRFRRFGNTMEPITNLYNDSLIFDLPARSFFIEWIGGPPNNRRWVKASLLAMLVDRCLESLIRGWTAQVCDAIEMAERYGCYEIQGQPICS
jgi:hypothetical protein